jgi:pimeloyl-ACP methyl ester carboxylesterase
MTSRQFLTSMTAGALSLLVLGAADGALEETTMTSTATQPRSPAPTAPETIRPFRYRATDAELADLRARILATRWPERETVTDASQGPQLAMVQKVARYWGTEYDWRKVESRLNSLPQFVTTIDGLDIHFIHVRSKHPNALPIIITHGWPGSIIEQMKLVGPLTDPTAYGGKAEDAFDVVIPSMPGYGFSGKPTATGWEPTRIARAWVVLMKRLGYTRYVAQGGDWGAFVTEQMGVQAPPELLGIHVNLASAVPADILKALQAGNGPPPGLSAEEKDACDRLVFLFTQGSAPQQMMVVHPQTLYGIADSPVGLAAWYLDHDLQSYEMIVRAFEGQPEGLSRDDVLDNITLTWLTTTGISSARIYRENKAPWLVPMHVTIPVAVSVFPDEVYQVPRSWAERAYPKLIYYKKADKGGHFAAWEQPQILSEDIRAGFRSLRGTKAASH